VVVVVVVASMLLRVVQWLVMMMNRRMGNVHVMVMNKSVLDRVNALSLDQPEEGVVKGHF
jgi:hypothetical protein